MWQESRYRASAYLPRPDKYLLCVLINILCHSLINMQMLSFQTCAFQTESAHKKDCWQRKFEENDFWNWFQSSATGMGWSFKPSRWRSGCVFLSTPDFTAILNRIGWNYTFCPVQVQRSDLRMGCLKSGSGLEQGGIIDQSAICSSMLHNLGLQIWFSKF